MQRQSQRDIMLKAEAIYRFIKGDDKIETLVMSPPEDVSLFAYDASIYEAMGSLVKEERQSINKMVKFFEVVNVLSYEKNFKRKKPILTNKRVDEIRNHQEESK
jgi:hypothetical protein